MLFITISCNDNEKVQPADGEGTEGEVEFLLTSSPGTYSTTDPGTLAERTVSELDVLVVKDDIFQYRRQAIQSVTSFRTTLVIDEGLTLYFIANQRTLLENSTELVEGKSWENDIRPSLILQDPTGLINAQLLPMWGIKSNVTIEKDIINQIGNINMLRAVASVDVYNTEETDVFTLQEAYLYFVPDKGYLAPSAALYDTDEEDVLTPGSPSDMQNYATGLRANKVENQAIAHQLYLYENDAPASSRRYSRLVVGGSYNGGETTYYPVDFLDDVDLYKILQITRNYKYQVVIGHVYSPGYPDPDTASEAYDSRMDLDVIDWNMEYENELVFDGPHYISLQRKQVYLYKPAGSYSTLTMTTNIDPTGLVMEFGSDKNGPMSQDGQYHIRNDRFEVEMLFDQNGKVEGLLFTALQEYNTTDIQSNLDILVISSNRMKLEIKIEQINESPTQWIDGGNIPVDVGEE
ncbi:MAG: hypothetical protein LUH15_21465 [Tannerellaceae bacterium]|nr:hypothetical protein [Tannerellaceae bacterium]